MMGSANITGSKLFHILSGNLSHQIEHHLFPDLPARRYPQIAGEVKALCEKYGLPYNTGRLVQAARLDLGEDLPPRAADRQRGAKRRPAGRYRGSGEGSGRRIASAHEGRGGHHGRQVRDRQGHHAGAD